MISLDNIETSFHAQLSCVKNFQILLASQPHLLSTSLYQWRWMWHKDNVPS